MAKKYELIHELYADTLDSFKEPQEWQSFLTSACRNYKCRFDEQVLIFAQDPNATAVLTLSDWNNKFARRVNKGATGIAVFESLNFGAGKIRYYFDIAKTNGTKHSRPVHLWNYSSDYSYRVIETLENTFGEINDKRSTSHAIFNSALNATEDNLGDYLESLYFSAEDSGLENFENDKVSQLFTELVSCSVTYMVLSRLGYNANEYFPTEVFENIKLFNTTKTLNTLGLATSDIAEMTLKEISRTILAIEKENAYTINNDTERNNDNGRDNIRETWGLPDTEHNSGTERESGAWSLRTDEAEVLGREPESGVRELTDNGRADTTLTADGRDGTTEIGKSDNSDGTETRSYGGAERERPNEMGGNDEQHQELSTGDSFGGDSLQLTSLPSYEEQTENIETAESDRASAFSISQEEVDYVLCSGGFGQDHKYRLYEYYTTNDSTKAEDIAFLKKEFGEGGRSAVGDSNISEWHSAKGLQMQKNKWTDEEVEVTLSWNNVSKRVKYLIEEDRYLNESEKAYYPEYLIKKAEQAKRWEVATEFNNILSEYNEYQRSLEEYDKCLNRYVLTGCSSDFAQLRDVTHSLTVKGDYTIPLMRDALKTISDENLPQFKERVQSMQEILKSEIAYPVLPLYERLALFYEDYDYYGYKDSLEVGEGIEESVAKMQVAIESKDNVNRIIEELVEIYETVDDELYEEKIIDFIKELRNIHFPLEYKYEYNINDIVYLGASKYEILSIGEGEVTLYDESFPLLNKTMDISSFEAELKESTDNNHLRVIVAEDAISQSEDIPEELEVIAEESEVIVDEVPIETVTEEVNNNDLVGIQVQIDDRSFIVDSIKSNGTDVSMRDITFQRSTGFPIFRIEPAEYVRSIIAVKEKIEELPAPVKEIKKQAHTLHPDISTADRHQFVITDDNLGVGTPREKFRNNIEAIKVLRACENEERLATPEEQEVLSKYVGWGGLSQAFDKDNSSWASEYLELQTLLEPEEYASARESTLTAFYTPPIVINAMYQALNQIGFEKGNILDPACGTGHFHGMLPDSMKESKVYGVELDTISGQIAQQLYQKSNIIVQGYENAPLPDSFFDIAVGNVPFGQFKVADKKYDKENWLIHDYFFGKTLDKVRPGGVVAFITSKGTMDKENPAVRRYLAQRAELLGAIRLPDDTFTKNAGTQVTSDIIFLQKRDRIVDVDPSWVHLDKDSNDITMNSYFVEHPEMVLGNMIMESTQYGPDSTCRAFEGRELKEILNSAITNIEAEYFDQEMLEEEVDNSIPADPTVRNFSFTAVDGEIYFRQNSVMLPVEVSETAQSRIKGMIDIRDCVRNLIEFQTEGYSDSEIEQEQTRLNELYDDFTKKYGLINSRGNKTAFSDDSSYFLLCSLENIDEDGNLKSKADMFTKRTISPRNTIVSVDTASEALAVSMAEKARIDMDYMSELSGKTAEEIEADLQGVVFRVPVPGDLQRIVYQTSDEYLSGNVREKLITAKKAAEQDPQYEINVLALEKVQPINLNASEISVRLGATWLPPQVIEDFMFNLLDTSNYSRSSIKVHYSEYTAEWNIENKNYDRFNVKATSSYGTNRMHAYKIIEDTLNLKDVRVYDYVEDIEGRKQQVLNRKETAIAQAKQELIKNAFTEWIWQDPTRRERLVRLYNDKFNSIRPREYDGQYLTLEGMNPSITLQKHQLDGVARHLYGGNTLLAHCVGAGKTYTMAAAAMESKRLGLNNKSLLVVPNHLTEQWATAFLTLYPSANILVATKKDFEMQNRKKFCGRIATGDYDAVIIGQSQFERIPMSLQRQREVIENQIFDVTRGIEELKQNNGERFSVKQLEKTKKNLQVRLEKLNDQSRKDDVVTFEQLGVDKLISDESHYYKNLFLYTKMRNVGGIAQTEAMKSSDMFMKVRYLDEITDGRGVIFATGTPISNSMVELYTMQRYLQYETLAKNKLQNFDAWASTFGETVTAIELAPEGTGYRAKTRFAKFYNLPELMNMFSEVADIKTADMLNLPVPIAHYESIAVKPSELQKEMVSSLAERAEKVRNKEVPNYEDNMLVITNDGRKLALDQRLITDSLPDEENSKVNACFENIHRIWEQGKAKKLTQLVFCDLSTPKSDGTFNVYTDIRDKLIAKGVPESEIAFIHDANTEVRKKDLFAKISSGTVRVLLGSTAKMGAGTNVQEKLYAIHDLDCPWRPSDLEQRAGRIVRQGNTNSDVYIYRYVTEETFDAYLYQIVENKQKFISQIMTSKSPVRSAEDIDEASLSYAEIKMLATGNPYIKEKMDLDISVARLKLLKQNHLSQKYALEDKLLNSYPKEITALHARIRGLEQDIHTIKQNTPLAQGEFLPMTVNGIVIEKKQEAGEAILEACKGIMNSDPVPFGEYRGFAMNIYYEPFVKEFKMALKGGVSHVISLGADVYGNITRIDNALESFNDKLTAAKDNLANTKVQISNAEIEVQKTFSQESELNEKTERLAELNILLNMNSRENEILDEEEQQTHDEIEEETIYEEEQCIEP